MKPIEAAFAEWWQCTGLEGRVDVVQFNETRRAFYAGYFASTTDHLGDELYETIEAEMRQFVADLQKGIK